jgi:hypothetical protein
MRLVNQIGLDPDLLSEYTQMMEEELEKAYPSYSDELPASAATTSDGKVVPVSDRDLEKVEKFAKEFDEELQGDDNRKIMFIMDIAIHVGETPDQLRELIDEKGIEPLYQMRMAIHLASKEYGVSYQEAGQIVADLIWAGFFSCP